MFSYILRIASEAGGLPLFLTSAAIGVSIGVLLNRFNILYIATHKVDEKSKRNGGEIVAEVLKAHGVEFLFTLVGGHISPILAASEKIGIKVIDTRHEVSAVFAADAVARLSGSVGVAAVTAGPGLTNTITAIKNAQMAESPVLLIGGAAATILKGRGALQDIDQMALFKPLCKYCTTVTSIRDIAPVLRRALQIAQSGVPGPVFVEFPIDVLYPYSMVKKEVGAKSGSKGLIPKIVNWYLNNYVDNIFAGAWEPFVATPLPVSVPLPKASEIQKCAELVSRAKRPLLLIGSQATLPPIPADKLRRTVERLGIPCYLGGMARGLLGKASRLQMRQQRREALKEADLVILAGSVCDFRLSYGRVLPSKAAIIAVNRNREQLLKNSDMFWKPTVAIEADAGSFLVELSAALAGHSCDSVWIDTLRKRDDEQEKVNANMAAQPTDTHLNPLLVLGKLEEALPENAILVADGGDFVGSAAYILRPRGPLTWLDPGAFGTLGVGGGFALGAKLARPDAEVWIIWGDGSSAYSLAEFDTMVRHKAPVLAVVGNDAAWSQIAREQIPLLGTDVACTLVHTAYEKVAEGYGATGYKIGREDQEKICEIFQKAREDCASGKSVCLNVMIGKSSFREGSISV